MGKNWLSNNFWLKLVSLVLALIVWLYVNGELAKRHF
jgi:YbbR domain-containing protein